MFTSTVHIPSPIDIDIDYDRPGVACRSLARCSGCAYVRAFRGQQVTGPCAGYL